MTLATSGNGKVSCTLCDWHYAGTDFDEAERRLLTHLRGSHRRLPALVCRTEKKPARPLFGARGALAGWEFPVCVYSGPRYEYASLRRY